MYNIITVKGSVKVGKTGRNRLPFNVQIRVHTRVGRSGSNRPKVWSAPVNGSHILDE